MNKSQIRTGDYVIPLAGLSRQCAVLAGFFGNALVAWKVRGGVIPPFAYGILCAAVGYLLGKAFGATFFPAKGDRVLVVKAGSSALPLTLLAAFGGAAAGALPPVVVLAFVLGGSLLVSVSIAVACVIVIGASFGLGAALA